MDSRPGLGGDLIPHGVRPDKTADALPAGASDAHCQEGHRPKAFMDDIRAGGAHINPQDAPIRRDGSGGRGDRRKCTGKHTQRRLTAQMVPTFQRPAA